MARPRPGAEQHRVEARREVLNVGSLREEGRGRARDAGALAPTHRLGRSSMVLARLDLDEGDDAAAPRDDVDLTGPHPQIACQDSEALEAQQPGGNAFRAPAAPPSSRTAHGAIHRRSSAVMARARA